MIRYGQDSITFNANSESELEFELLYAVIAIVHQGEPLSQVTGAAGVSTAILLFRKCTSGLIATSCVLRPPLRLIVVRTSWCLDMADRARLEAESDCETEAGIDGPSDPELEDVEDLSDSPPKAKSRKFAGAATYRTEFKPIWRKEFPFISTVPSDPFRWGSACSKPEIAKFI